VYVHCTAGLGRSPAVAIASLYWFTDLQLDEAYSYLTRIRPCGPSKVSKRQHFLCASCCASEGT
jgi:protein-tyrosine phosphatase